MWFKAMRPAANYFTKGAVFLVRTRKIRAKGENDITFCQLNVGYIMEMYKVEFEFIIQWCLSHNNESVNEKAE